jgi:hypothetical protein
MFIFAIYGVQIIGGQLARCNDRTYYKNQVCQRKIFIKLIETFDYRHHVVEHFGENFMYQK